MHLEDMQCRSRISWEKDLLIRLETSKSSIKGLFSDLLDETKGFKDQITLNVELKKYKGTEIEFSPVYYNSTTKSNDKS